MGVGIWGGDSLELDWCFASYVFISIRTTEVRKKDLYPLCNIENVQ